MQVKELSFRETGHFSDLILDYVDQKPELKHFYKYPLSLDIFPRIIEEKKMQAIDRELLVSVLKEQYADISGSEKVNKNIEALRSENTFTITTAHQLSIFTGPLYFHIKIICAINLCKKLKSLYPEFDFVPVYWMGSEDHDFDEINSINLFNQKIEWKSQPEGPVGRMNSKRLKKAIEEIEEVIGNSENANEILQLFRNAYLHHDSVADATRFLVNELYKEYGLVVVDGDNAALKKPLVPVMEEELFQRSSENLVSKVTNELGKKYKIQAPPREINLFYMKDGFRERIVFNAGNDDFEVLNTRLFLNVEALRQELNEHPEHFSPNVILRPLHQEMILPNLAYIGGSGEIAYWMELEKLFEYHKVNFPMLVVRNSVLWIDSNIKRKMDALGLTVDDLFEDEDRVIKKYVEERLDEEISFSDEKERISQTFQSMLKKAVEIDPTLEKAVLGEEQRTINSIEKLEAKALKAEKRKYDTAINQIKSINSKLFPERTLQERYDNFIPYYLKYGQGFISTLVDKLKPIDNQFTIIVEKD